MCHRVEEKSENSNINPSNFCWLQNFTKHCVFEVNSQPWLQLDKSSKRRTMGCNVQEFRLFFICRVEKFAIPTDDHSTVCYVYKRLWWSFSTRNAYVFNKCKAISCIKVSYTNFHSSNFSVLGVLWFAFNTFNVLRLTCSYPNHISPKHMCVFIWKSKHFRYNVLILFNLYGFHVPCLLFIISFYTDEPWVIWCSVIWCSLFTVTKRVLFVEN